MKAFVNIFMLTICVPAFARRMSKKSSSSPASIDILGCKTALVISIVGTVMIAASAQVWMIIVCESGTPSRQKDLFADLAYIQALMIYAAGSVLPVFMYSLVRCPDISNLDAASEGRAFATVVLCNSAGTLVGTPFFTALWVRAIGIGGAGLGLPFYVSAVCVHRS